MTTPSTTKEANGFYFPRMVHYPDTLLLLNTDPTAQALLDQASAAYYCQGLDDIGNLDYEALLAALSIFRQELYPESSFEFFKKVWPARKAILDKAYETSMARSKTYSENGAKGGRPRKSDPEPAQLEPEVKPKAKPTPVVKPPAMDADDKYDVSQEVDELFAFIKGLWPKDRLNDFDVFELGKLLKYYDLDAFKENVVQYIIWRAKQEKEKGEFKGYHFSKFISDELFRNYTKKYQGKSRKPIEGINQVAATEAKDKPWIFPSDIEDLMYVSPPWLTEPTSEIMDTVKDIIINRREQAVYNAFREFMPHALPDGEDLIHFVKYDLVNILDGDRSCIFSRLEEFE